MSLRNSGLMDGSNIVNALAESKGEKV